MGAMQASTKMGIDEVSQNAQKKHQEVPVNADGRVAPSD